MALVVHCKKASYDVYIGRPSKWGNPFRIGPRSRTEAIRLYREWLLSRPDIVKEAQQELKGKVLGCWCKPYACHGDVLAEVANAGTDLQRDEEGLHH